jgi:steroid Delta-isomerase
LFAFVSGAQIHDVLGTLVAAQDGRSVAVPVTASMINVTDPELKRVSVNTIVTFQIGDEGLIREMRVYYGHSDVNPAP